MGEILRVEMDGSKKIKRFPVHFNMNTPLEIVFLNNFKILGPLQK
jgi:hypothetical protein